MATLLESVFAIEGSAQEVEERILERLRTGSLKLSGNFRGQEHRILGERSDALEGRAAPPAERAAVHRDPADPLLSSSPRFGARSPGTRPWTGAAIR